MKIVFAALFFLVLFVGVEYITRKFKLNKELSRKFVHIIVGIIIAFLPLIMSFDQIAILAALFIPVMLLSKQKKIFSSIHHVKRQTYGEVYFPISIVLTALLFPKRYTFMYGILIMAISDGFASVIGQKYGKKTYSIFNSLKSYIGSTVFLISGIIIGFALLSIQTNIGIYDSIIICVICAAILTFVEGCSSYGLDNLILPPISALLIESLVKVIK